MCEVGLGRLVIFQTLENKARSTAVALPVEVNGLVAIANIVGTA
jgi:hypothetical protein